MIGKVWVAPCFRPLGAYPQAGVMSHRSLLSFRQHTALLTYCFTNQKYEFYVGIFVQKSEVIVDSVVLFFIRLLNN